MEKKFNISTQIVMELLKDRLKKTSTCPKEILLSYADYTEVMKKLSEEPKSSMWIDAPYGKVKISYNPEHLDNYVDWSVLAENFHRN